MNRTQFVQLFGRPFFDGLTRIAAPFRVYGRDRIPLNGPVVLCFNHFSWADPWAIGSQVPRTLYYVAKQEAHDTPFIGQLIRAFGTISVRRGESDREAVRLMREIVHRGDALGMFPEGTRQELEPGPVLPGAAMIAVQEGAPVVCGAIHGSQFWKPGNFHPISVAFGEPLDVTGHPKNSKGYRAAALDIQHELRRLWEFLVLTHEQGTAARGDPTEMSETVEAPLIGTVAIVGFPNVGKSTLVNRLTGSRAAVVHETSGVTRDRKELVADWNGKRFLLIDTGGVDIADRSPMTQSIAVQAKEAVSQADLVLFVVDAKAGVSPGDEEVADILRRARKPVLLIANKIDDPSQESLALDLHRLGLGDPIPISALHGHSTGDLLDLVVDQLPGTGRAEIPEEAIRVAILGRPNVGKSSLLNAILGRERVIVSETPGTTRDSIDTIFERGDRTFVLVDTAGIRRKRRHRQGIEYYSELRAREAAERADVALVLIDTSEGLVDHDLAIADIARKAQDSTMVVLSKWDETTIGIEDIRPELERRLRQRPPHVAVSSKTGRGIERLLDGIEKLYDKHVARVSTSELNRFLAELREARQPPSRKDKRLNLMYGAQVSARPPRFRFSVNDPTLVTRDYGYWVENQLRERFELEGVPVTIDFVPR